MGKNIYNLTKTGWENSQIFCDYFFQENIEAKFPDLPNFIQLEAKAEASFQEEIKKLNELSRRRDLEDRKLKEFEEFSENFQNTVAREIYVREQEAKAHEEWMKQKELEEQGKSEIHFRLTQAGK